MKNILLLNGAKKFGSSGARLNNSLHEIAKHKLLNLGLGVNETYIDRPYEVEEEVQKILHADAIIYQMPLWWMGEPWIVKKYIDEVFSAGHGKFYINDGRSTQDPNKQYGSGGLLKHKRYMFSLTCNAPLKAFHDKDEFFQGLGVDGVYLHLHKANQFLGMKPLPSFVCYDVIKNPNFEQYIRDYKTHLLKLFKD